MICAYAKYHMVKIETWYGKKRLEENTGKTKVMTGCIRTTHTQDYTGHHHR